jgi:hypothetical protein
MRPKMSRRFLAFAGAAVMAIVPLTAQTPAKSWNPPRTPDGQPDLQGIWNTATLTPLERPNELGAKQFFTKEEAAEFEKQALKSVDADRRDGGATADVGRAYNEFWRERGRVVPSLRTSLIVDPPDGHVPSLTPAAQKLVAARAEYKRLHPGDGPEDRSPIERCIAASNAGPPMMPANYNSNYQIVQSAGHVAILSEQIHDARVIPLDGRPHVPENLRLWMGDPRGRWEGNTLVVETTNFTDQTNFQNSGAGLRLVERFTRTDPNTIRYEFTVNDPATYTKPWTAQIFMMKSQEPVLEYACQEGNYAMEGILAGIRVEEKAAVVKTETRGSK